jgi:hypothetical protein
MFLSCCCNVNFGFEHQYTIVALDCDFYFLLGMLLSVTSVCTLCHVAGTAA